MAGIGGAGRLVGGIAVRGVPVHPDAATARVITSTIAVVVFLRTRPTFEPVSPATATESVVAAHLVELPSQYGWGGPNSDGRLRGVVSRRQLEGFVVGTRLHRNAIHLVPVRGRVSKRSGGGRCMVTNGRAHRPS